MGRCSGGLGGNFEILNPLPAFRKFATDEAINFKFGTPIRSPMASPTTRMIKCLQKQRGQGPVAEF